jgi:hypothetical protein
VSVAWFVSALSFSAFINVDASADVNYVFELPAFAFWFASSVRVNPAFACAFRDARAFSQL